MSDTENSLQEQANNENTPKIPLSEQDLDNLQWAKDFMNRYERKHRKDKTVN